MGLNDNRNDGGNDNNDDGDGDDDGEIMQSEMHVFMTEIAQIRVNDAIFRILRPINNFYLKS